jgi:hypothetical protein
LQELGDSIAELVGAMQKQIDTADLYKNKEDIMCHWGKLEAETDDLEFKLELSDGKRIKVQCSKILKRRIDQNMEAEHELNNQCEMHLAHYVSQCNSHLITRPLLRLAVSRMSLTRWTMTALCLQFR